MRPHLYILDADGAIVPAANVLEWGQWLEEEPLRRVLEQTIIGDTLVSTIFTGIDYAIFTDDPPRLWETMVFVNDHSTDGRRYTSREDALKGHAFFVHYVTEQQGILNGAKQTD